MSMKTGKKNKKQTICYSLVLIILNILLFYLIHVIELFKTNPEVIS